MTHTLISLISIFIGIIGANLMCWLFTKYSLGKIGNTIAGVFGGILFIKSLGRLGFSPNHIVVEGITHWGLLSLNFLISFGGGVFGLLLIYYIRKKMTSF